MKQSFVVSTRVSEREFKALEIMAITMGMSTSSLLKMIVRSATIPTLKAFQENKVDPDNLTGIINYLKAFNEVDNNDIKTTN